MKYNIQLRIPVVVFEGKTLYHNFSTLSDTKYAKGTQLIVSMRSARTGWQTEERVATVNQSTYANRQRAHLKRADLPKIVETLEEGVLSLSAAIEGNS